MIALNQLILRYNATNNLAQKTAILHDISAHYGTPAMLREYWAKLTPTKRAELINAVDLDGKTPYQLAKDCNSTNDRLEMMETLASYGATIDRSLSPYL